MSWASKSKRNASQSQVQPSHSVSLSPTQPASLTKNSSRKFLKEASEDAIKLLTLSHSHISIPLPSPVHTHEDTRHRMTVKQEAGQKRETASSLAGKRVG